MPGDDHPPAGQHRPRPPSVGPARRPAPAGSVATAALVAIYGWWTVGLTPFSWEATVAVIGAGAATVVWAVWRRRAGTRGRPDPGGARGTGGAPRAGVAPWALLAAVAAAWQLAAYMQQPRDDHPTLSSLTNVALDSHAARAAAFVVWVFTTVALVRR